MAGIEYIPGTCNMGKQEILLRTKVGWIGVVLTTLVIGLLFWLEVEKIWRLLVFIPALIAATGFIQAYSKFCVYFGFKQLSNFNQVGKTDTVDQMEYRAKDRAHAWELVNYAIVVGILVTLITYLLP